MIRFAELYHQVKFPQAVALLHQWLGLAPMLNDSNGLLSPSVTSARRGRCLSKATWNPISGADGTHADRLCARSMPARSPDGVGLLAPGVASSRLGDNPGHDTYVHRIVFPLEGNLYGRSLSASAPSHRFLPGLKGGLYSWDQVRRYPEVILVEGLFDYAALWQAGFRNVTCSLGTHLNTCQLRQLCDGSRTVYLAFDADHNGSGQKAAQSLACRLKEHGINTRTIWLPEGHDPNSYFAQGGDARQFQCLLEAAR